MSNIACQINQTPGQVVSENNETLDLIREDCCLPVNIKAKKSQQSIKTQEIQRILLTGSTGNIGPYILRELMKMSQIIKVFCLVRPSNEKADPKDSENRLKRTLEDMGLLEEIDMDKVAVIIGDVTKKFFGLNDSAWQELIDTTDAVIHCAARVSYLQKYAKIPGSKGDVRSVNLAATKNILQFACSGLKLKHVFYSSSIVGCVTADIKEMRLTEDWPNLEDFDGKLASSTLGYPISKFVGEMLMKVAVTERGIPGKVFRFPLVGGDSKDGRKQIDRNGFFDFYLFALKNGILLSDSCFSPLLPVDQCAEVGVKLFFNHDAPHGVYNIGNRPVTEMEFGRLASKFGYELKKFQTFGIMLKMIRLVSGDSKLSKAIRFLIPNDDSSSEDSSPHLVMFPALRFYDPKKTPNFFESRKLKMFQPEVYNKLDTAYECLERDIAYAKSHGWIGNCNYFWTFVRFVMTVNYYHAIFPIAIFSILFYHVLI